MPPPFHISYTLMTCLFHVVHRSKTLLLLWRVLISIAAGWSWQEANKEKSNIYFSQNTPRRVKMGIKTITELKKFYLRKLNTWGTRLLWGRSKIKEFGRLKERVQKETNKLWKHKLLSNAGRATLIKSVIVIGKSEYLIIVVSS